MPDATYSVVDNDPVNGDSRIIYPICKKFTSDTSSIGFLSALTQATAFLVVLISFVLRTCFIKLIGCTKENKNSSIA